MVDLVLYVLQLCLVAGLLALAISLYIDGLGYVVLHVLAMAGVGAYIFAVLATRYRWPPILGALVAASSTAFVGLFCAEAIRTLRGDGLTLATFGIGVGSFEVFRDLDITGGVFGIGGVPFLVGDGGRASQAGVVLLALLLATGLVHAWRRSVGGTVVAALRMDEWGALSVGAPLVAHQRATGLLAGVVAGLGGVYFAATTHFVEPRDFQVNALLVPLGAVIVAGGRTPWGVVIMAAGIVLLSQAARFFGGSPVVAGPLTEIAVASSLAATLVFIRLRQLRRNDARG